MRTRGKVPQVHLTRQGGLHSTYFGLCSKSDVLTCHGTALGAALVGTDTATWKALSQASAETTYTGYLSSRLALTTAHYIIWDVEAPHLSDLHTYTAQEQDDIGDGMMTRLAAMRAVTPTAKIGLWATMEPDERGRADDASYLSRKAAIEAQVARGLLDDVDFLAPLLYFRFGPLDTVGRWRSLPSYLRLGLAASRALHPSLPMIPVLSVRVLNGTSAHNNTLLPDLPSFRGQRGIDATWTRALDILGDEGIADVIAWTGGADSDVLEDPNPNGLRLTTDYLSCP